MKYSLSALIVAAIVALACKPGAPLRPARDPGKGRSPGEQSEPGDVLDAEFARAPICCVARCFLGSLFADSRQHGTAGIELVIDGVRGLSPRNPRSSALLVRPRPRNAAQPGKVGRCQASPPAVEVRVNSDVRIVKHVCTWRWAALAMECFFYRWWV